MPEITAYGRLLAADTTARTLTGRLLPYGEQGRTSAGMVTAARGVVTWPADPSRVMLNLGHDRNAPVGRATSITEDQAGLTATFSVAATPAGDQLLAEASAGLRSGLSVELDGYAVKDGQLTAGQLSGVGAVVEPAFPSALLTAADTPTDPTTTATADCPVCGESLDLIVSPMTDAAATAAAPTCPHCGAWLSVATPGGPDPAPGEDPMPTTEPVVASTPAPTQQMVASAPAGVPGRRLTATQRGPATPRDAFRLIAEAVSQWQGDDARLTAALADVVYGVGTDTSIGNVTRQPQWLGELWSGVVYQREIIPLLSSGTLTGMKAQGFRVVNRPTVAEWAGDKTAITGTAPTVEPVSTQAKRYAGGVDIDRALIDFAEWSTVEACLRYMAESAAKLTDGWALADLTAAATDNPIAGGSIPAGVSTAAAFIVDGALEIRRTLKQDPTFALVSLADYRALILSKELDKLAYLASNAGFEQAALSGLTIRPHEDLDAGDVIVGHKSAVKVFEPAGVPIRMSAVDIVKGGYDEALFGYYASLVEVPEGVVLVSAA